MPMVQEISVRKTQAECIEGAVATVCGPFQGCFASSDTGKLKAILPRLIADARENNAHIGWVRKLYPDLAAHLRALADELEREDGRL